MGKRIAEPVQMARRIMNYTNAMTKIAVAGDLARMAETIMEGYDEEMVQDLRRLEKQANSLLPRLLKKITDIESFLAEYDPE